MKVISKLYIPDVDLTSVVISFVKNQEMIKNIVDSNNKTFRVVGFGMNQRLELNGVTDLHVKGNYDDNVISSIEYGD